MTKRRFVEQLPSRLQSEDLQKFFSATVDHLYQPGSGEQVTGYIGQRPVYTDDSKDFYVSEPTAERAGRQLEPTMVQRSADTAIERVLFFSDLVGYLRSNGGIVTDEGRLFDSDYYAWAPPVDIDKLNNPQNYYWFGNVSSLPAMILRAPSIVYDAIGGAIFAMPPVINGYLTQSPMVYVDGILIAPNALTVFGNNIILHSTPSLGQIVEVIRYGDLKSVIEGNATFDVSALFDSATTLTYNNMTGQTFGIIGLLSTGMRVVLRDGLRRDTGTTAIDSFIVDGVGESIFFFDHSNIPTTDPAYFVMDRRCRDRNPWARSNMWIHRAAIRWTGMLFSGNVATRPILDFQADLELYRYGPSGGIIAGVIDSNPLLGLAWDETEFDTLNVDRENVALTWDNVQKINVAQIIGQPMGSVFTSSGYALELGDRVLIDMDVPGHPELSNIICVVTSTIGSYGALINLAPEAAPFAGTIVIRPSDGATFYWNGAVWLPSQSFIAGDPPLFALYDIAGVALDDPEIYPKSTFVGSRLFGTALGSGPADAVLGVPLNYDTYGQIIYENDISTRRQTYVFGGNTTEIKGFYFFRRLGLTVDKDTFGNDWHLSATPTINDPLTFELPKNLTANPNNETVGLISKNEWFDHFSSILSGQDDFVGDVFGENNWRDTTHDLSRGMKILQHRSPMLKTMLMASDTMFDLGDAIRYVDQEYTRFRYRFIQTVTDFYMTGKMASGSTYDQWVVSVLNAMKANKTVDFPFAYSDAAGGQFFVPPSPAVLGLITPVIPAIITDKSFSVPVRMLLGHDGSRTPLFSQHQTVVYQSGPAVVVLPSEPFGDISVTINDVATTAFTTTGRIVTLNTNPATNSVIDVLVSDIRDLVNLAFDQRLYANINATFKAADYQGYDFVSAIEGKFRISDRSYERDEVTRILTPMFLRWTQTNGLNYQNNISFDQSDPFTFNYSRSVDFDGQTLPGNWRGIYRWYFDTDRPNECPWEMLGFSNKPTWWDSQYGLAPYQRTNTQLWNDIRDGLIRHGTRAGVDSRYVRPDFLKYLPVDNAGDLIDPISAGIVETPLYQDSIRSWVFGDGAPIENIWRNTSSYRFALSLAGYLMKPARFVENGWDTLNVVKINGDQYIYLPTEDRPKNSEFNIHGETISTGEIVKVTGIQQWVCDLMVSKGQAVSKFGNAVRGLNVQLSHKMAGFTTAGNMRVVADNFGLVPQEDVSVFLYSSPSVREEFYSGIIVEWTGSGWSLTGYNATDPNFYVVRGDSAGPKAVVSITDIPEPVIVDWRPNTYYSLNSLIDFEGSVYQAIRGHTSTSNFKKDLSDFWTARPGILRAQNTRVVKYLSRGNYIDVVPYGTEFTTLQDVADVIFGHETYLKDHGWIFDSMDPDTQDPNDWSSSVREFLQWSQYAWSPGYFIALSPGFAGLHFNTDHGMVRNLEQTFGGTYGIVDRAGLPISRRDTFVTRIDGDIVISSKRELYGVRLNIGEIEHALVFENATIFNDIIYEPLFDLRQPRLRLIGQRTTDWTGRLDAPGYVLINNDIKPNFYRATENIREMFDIENVEPGTLRDHARHLIGYESRSYLEKLLLSDTEQFEFYQGMIQQKGAPSIFEKMLRSQFVDQNRSLKFLDEWAVKLGGYGAQTARNTISFELHQSEILRNPQFVRFSTEPSPDDSVYLSGSRFVSPPSNISAAFNARPDYLPMPGALPSAGYARLTEVNYTALKITDVAALYKTDAAVINKDPLPVGSRIWVYDNGLGDWDVLRVSNMSYDGTPNTILRVEPDPITDAFIGAHIYLAKAHGLTSADIGSYMVVHSVARTDREIVGVNRITGVGSDWVAIDAQIDTGYRWVDNGFGASLPTANDPEDAPLIHILRSTRFADATALNAASWFFPVINEVSYLDQDVSIGWKVVSWDGTTWQTIREQPQKIDTSRVLSTLIYDTTSQISSSRLLIEPLLLDRFLVLDPIGGLISGDAQRELTFKIEYDPAEYVTEGWSGEHVGELWWDLSTARFLEAETDRDISISPRGKSELNYRINSWAKIAPSSRIDVYEWTRSLVLPADWNTQGTKTYLGADTPFVQVEEYDPALDRNVTVYYFWVKGSTVVPPTKTVERRIDAAQVASIITSPTSLDISWLSPITADGLLVSGINQFLLENGSIVQLQVKSLDYDGVVHNEWGILRNGDDSSQPPANLWNKLIDSVSGINLFKQPVPDPSLHESARQGILVRPAQSLFGGPKDPRTTILAARESLIAMINIILARSSAVIDRSNIVSIFSQEHVLRPTQVWTDEEPWLGNLPIGDYSDVVTTLADRNLLLLTPGFRDQKRRVLIDRLMDSPSHWSIWEYDPANDTFADNDSARLAAADTLFTLARSYKFIVATKAERNAMAAPNIGDVTWVVHDEDADGFWTTWVYDPTSSSADTNGYVLREIQDFRLTDFWNYVDWYAVGYAANVPPVIIYDTIATRDAVESLTPRTSFVKVNDDGTGKWIWTVYLNGSWTVVARENGTIQFKNTFYDPTRVVFNVSSKVASDVKNRDGTLEIRALLQLLKGDVLNDIGSAFTAAELNELFFSMVNFAHAYLDQVSWAFKTSFLYIGGYNEKLTQTAIETFDNTENLISYVNEVKPYRVKMREFSRVLATELQLANAHATDFDNPVYFDPTINAYRPLDLTLDLNTISTQNPWKDWYNNYSNTGYDLSNYSAITWNPIRRPKTTILFDRIDGVLGIPNQTGFGTGWDDDIFDDSNAAISWDNNFQFNGAAYRIQNYYNPSQSMPENSLEVLLNLDFKGSNIDGSDIETPGTLQRLISGTGGSYDVLLNPAVGSEPGLRLNDPQRHEDRPEELIVGGNTDNVAITVRSLGVPGAPIQCAKFFDVSLETGSDVCLTYGLIPQSNDGVIVFLDGLVADPSSYVIDFFARTVTVSLIKPDASRVHGVTVKIIGPGGESKIVEQKFYDYIGGNPQTFAVSSTSGFVEAIVNGQIVNATFASGVVTITPTLHTGDDVMINIRETAGSGIYVTSQDLTWNMLQQWTLPSPSTPSVPWAHASTIVEVDGVRLRPPETQYANLSNVQYVTFAGTPTTSQITIYLNGVLYTGAINTGSFSSIANVLAGGPYTGSFVLWGSILVCVDSMLAADMTAVAIGNEDYTVNGAGLLHISKTVSSSSIIRATTFQNNTSMGIETRIFNGSAQSFYAHHPIDSHYLWTTINGQYQTAGIDYSFTLSNPTDGFDVLGWDADDQWDAAVPPTVGLQFGNVQQNTDCVIVTAFTGTPMALPHGFQAATVRPGKSLMLGVLSGDWDLVGWDDNDINPNNLWDAGDELATASSTQGIKPIYTMDDGWEYFRISDGHIGQLTANTSISASTIDISLPPNAKDVFDASPFRLPQPDASGIVWVNGERIEYSGISTAGSTVTLSGILRGSKGTHIGSEKKNVKVFLVVAQDPNSNIGWDIEGLDLDIWDDPQSGQKIYTVPWTGGNVLVTLYTADGLPTTLQEGLQYTVSVTDTDLSIILNDAPDAGTYVTLIQTLSILTQPQYSEVRALVNQFEPSNIAL
jgi:hypothetical protein